MNTAQATQIGRRRASRIGWLAAMGGLFFLSGVSSLLYEVVWLRMLGRQLGNTAYATAIVLAAFMGGLCAGSYFAGRFVDRSRRPLLVYALLELGIAASAALSLGLVNQLPPIYRALYEWAGGSRIPLTEARLLTALLLLLVPTTLMGATLPTLSAFAGRRHEPFARSAGMLYAINTFGAVVGVLLAGFVLIGSVGESRTLVIGVALNVVVTASALTLLRDADGAVCEFPRARLGIGRTADGTRRDSQPLIEYPSCARGGVLMIIVAGGFIALASEVVWGRMLLLYQGTSIYAFSAMLAVLLTGMGLGSLAGARVADRCRDPLGLLAHLEMAAGLSGLVALHLYGFGGAVKPNLGTGEGLSVIVAAPVLLLGPLGFVWGLIFPLAVRCYAVGVAEATGGRDVAALYTGNTLGGIAGALAGGFVLVPWLGVSGTGAVLAAASLLLGTLLFLVHPGGYRRASWMVQGGLATMGALLITTVGDPYGRFLHQAMERTVPRNLVLYRQTEGPAATTTVFGPNDGDRRARHLWIDGEGMTALVPITKLMAHLPLLLADTRKQILVVCFGMGTTVRSASRHEGLETWAVDLIPAVFEDVAYFHPDGPSLLRRPDVHPVVDDGRNYLLLHSRQYDVITVDPAPPLYSAGAVNLYSREFFQLCRQRLRPGGVMCLWVPAGNASEVKAIMRTFLDVFAHVTAWESPLQQPGAWGLYLLGAAHPFQNLEGKIRNGYRNPVVVADLVEWGTECDRPEKILGLFLADERTLRPGLLQAPNITDDRPFTEFPLWRALRHDPKYAVNLDGECLRRDLGIDRR